MRNNRRYLSNLITARYLTGLVSIGLFVTASFIMVAITVEMQRNRSEIVEFAAKQRLSSQRIGYLTNALVNTDDEEMRQRYRAALNKIIRDMAARNKILSLESGANLPVGMRSILEQIYHAGGIPFDDQVHRFLDNARVIAGAPDEDLRTDMPELIKLNFHFVDNMLGTHELVVGLLRKEEIEGVNRVLRLAVVLWILTLTFLALEVPIIFQPMSRRASQILDHIQAERLKAEREAEAAEAAREGQASFIRTMSHELRTPLNAVLGMNQLLLMSGLNKKQSEYAGDIDLAGRHLLGLIDEILEFGSLEAKQVTIRKEPASLVAELERVAQMLKSDAESKGLRLASELDDRLSGSYLADGLRIRQVLLNLVGNAIKFTEEGSVVLRAVLAGSAGPNADLARFEVEDTGIGVPAEVQARIFERFQQGDTSLARKHGGSGLGLAISSRLVSLMGGEIGVEGMVGGSVFWFTLPLERAPALDQLSGQPDQP